MLNTGTAAGGVRMCVQGVPGEPRCGFSSKIVQLLSDHKVEYASFDILTDADVRQGLKEFSDWPTFPQLYMKGEFIGAYPPVYPCSAPVPTLGFITRRQYSDLCSFTYGTNTAS